MNYLISEIAKIANVSTRTLRYYDQIGLIKPSSILPNGYRVYDDKELDILQEILIYKELGFNLIDIKRILLSKDYNREKALNNHLKSLFKEQDRINLLIDNVKKTISTIKGEYKMTNEEKFIGLKESIIEKNEKMYGTEIRKKYGDKMVNEANKKILNSSPEELDKSNDLENQILIKLNEAYHTNDINSPLAKEVCELHALWLKSKWPSNAYSKEMHLALAESYLDDQRFIDYYDSKSKGCTKFLVDALKNYLK